MVEEEINQGFHMNRFIIKEAKRYIYPWSLEEIQLKRQPIVPGMIFHLL